MSAVSTRDGQPLAEACARRDRFTDDHLLQTIVERRIVRTATGRNSAVHRAEQ